MEKQSKIDIEKHLQGEGPAFFKASEMAGNKTKVKIVRVREINLPNSGDTVVIDFDYKKEERSLPLNKTNMKKLVELFGLDVNKWIGQSVNFVKVLVTNPKTKKEVESIRIR